MTNSDRNRHVFIFNSDSNGGESLILETVFGRQSVGSIKNDDGLIESQKLTLNSYGKAMTADIGPSFTPAILRRLADELEKHQLDLVLNRPTVVKVTVGKQI